MVVHHTRLKSWSELREKEVDDTLSGILDSFSNDEVELFNELVSNNQFFSKIASLEYDEFPVPIDQWLEDPYYLGDAVRNLYKEWREDLVELFSSGQYYVGFVTGSLGCIHESTLLDTIHGQISCADIKSSTLYKSWTGSRFEYRPGTAPFRKGKGDLYRVVHEHGEFVAFGEHLILCSDGSYRSLNQLRGQRFSLLSPKKTNGYSRCCFQTNLADVQSILLSDAHHWMNGLLDYQDCCSKNYRLCGERLLLDLGIDPRCFPSLIDVQELSRARMKAICNERMDAFVGREHTRNHQQILFVLLSMLDFLSLVPALSGSLGESVSSQISQHVAICSRQFRRCLGLCEHRQQESESFLSLLQTARTCSYGGLLQLADCLAALFPDDAHIFEQYRHLFPGFLLFSMQSFLLNKVPLSERSFLGKAVLPFDAPVIDSRVISIERNGFDWYWDLQVPGTHNYVAHGSIHHNSGKSEFSSIAILRMVYEASCLKNPALSYGLNPGSKVDFGIFAPNEHVARNAAFDKIVSKIRLSPYFLEKFPPLNKMSDTRAFKQNTLNFPKDVNIVCGSSTNTAALGGNLMGAFVDELNFFQKVAKSKVAVDSRFGESEKAGKLFDGLMRRMKSRFMRRGKLPGVLIGASSKDLHDSLIQRLIRNAAAVGDERVFVRDRSILELKADQYGDKKFRVLLPSEHYRGRILEGDETLEQYDEPIVIDVPEEFRADFDQDLEGSLRDIAGVSTFAIANFISHTEKIEGMKDGRLHPFTSPLSPVSRWWDSVSRYQMNWPEMAVQLDNGEWEPRLNPHAKRFIHLDPASSGDAFGLCMGHVAGLRETKTNDMTEYQPIFKIDFILKIVGSREQNIVFRNVRKLIYDFTNHGFSIACITMDTFQSLEMRQFLSQQNYRTQILSVDESKEPYRYLRTAMYEDRVQVYDYPELFEEMRTLEDTPRMIDHPSNSSKDLSDSLCGMVYMAGLESVNMSSLPIISGESVVQTNDSEQFEEQVRGDPIYGSVPAVCQYKKKPKTVQPAYNKITSEGNVIDMRSQKTLSVTDLIEIG